MNDRTFQARDAHRLDDPERLNWLPPADTIDRLGVQPAMQVADIGTGTGYFAIPIARRIGEKGTVYAVDMQEEMLAVVGAKLSLPGAPRNIVTVRGKASQTTLADNSADLVFMANLWHELDDHAAVLGESSRVLRTNGRLAVLDWRTDVTRPPGPPLEHRVAMESVVAVLRNTGWEIQHSSHVGQYSYIVLAIVARK